MKRTAKKLITALTAVFLAVFSAFSTPLSAVVGFADEETQTKTTVKNFDTTDIMEDLSDVNSFNYPVNEYGVPEVIRFQEWCYSAKEFYNQYYGVYVYIYNPTCNPLREDYNFQKVNMATLYDEAGEPTAYENIRLKYCSKTEDYRFYKFRIADSQEREEMLERVKAYAEKHDGARRYDMASLQLTHENGDTYDTTTKDYNWAKTYYFTGFAKGCGADGNADSTLECSVEGLKTLRLKVNHTNWRSPDDKDGNPEPYTDDNPEETHDQLNSVYFSVPNEYFESYGGLQKIKAEWYEYKTKEIFATSDTGAYNALFDYIAVNIGESSADLPWRVIWDMYLYNNANVHASALIMGGAYNKRKFPQEWWESAFVGPYIYSDDYKGTLTYPNTYEEVNCVNQLDWLLPIKSKNEEISSLEIMQYAKWYTENIAPNGEMIQGADGEYSAGLFEDSIDEDRLGLLKVNENKTFDQYVASNGYVCQEIDAKDTGSYDVIDQDQSWWDKLWHGVQYAEEEYDPIVVLGKTEYETISNMTDTEFAEAYLVDKHQASEVKTYCINQISYGNKVVLFRFAKTDYYVSSACFDYEGNARSENDGYVAQETVFLDFDIISLTFRSDKKGDTVIAVVSDPLDIFAGLQPPDGKEDNTGAFVGLIAGIITLFIFVAILVVVGMYYPPIGNFMLNALGKILRFLWEAIKYLSIAVWNAIVFLCTWLIYKPIKGMINGIAYLLDNPSENNLPLAKKQNESASKPVAKKSVKKKTSSGKAPVRRKKK